VRNILAVDMDSSTAKRVFDGSKIIPPAEQKAAKARAARVRYRVVGTNLVAHQACTISAQALAQLATPDFIDAFSQAVRVPMRHAS
jgi:hypothetical protein